MVGLFCSHSIYLPHLILWTFQEVRYRCPFPRLSEAGEMRFIVNMPSKNQARKRIKMSCYDMFDTYQSSIFFSSFANIASSSSLLSTLNQRSSVRRGRSEGKTAILNYYSQPLTGTPLTPNPQGSRVVSLPFWEFMRVALIMI